MKKQIAEALLNIEAVSLQPTKPFTWSSGLRSPIYCDNRLTMSYPSIRRQIAGGLSEHIKTAFPEVELIAGTATAGIPHAAWVSEQLDLPMAYIRSSAKGHGKENKIEGYVKEGQKVVVVEDLISTGGSVLQAVDALEQVGAVVLGVVAIFTYELPRGTQAFADAGLTVHTLTDFSTLIRVAEERGDISEEEWNSLKTWRENPENWSSSR